MTKLSRTNKTKLLEYLEVSSTEELLSNLWERYKNKISHRKGNQKYKWYDPRQVWYWVKLIQNFYSLPTIKDAQKKLLKDGLPIAPLTPEEQEALELETGVQAMYQTHGRRRKLGLSDPIQGAKHKIQLQEDYKRIFYTGGRGGIRQKISLKRTQALYEEGRNEEIKNHMRTEQVNKKVASQHVDSVVCAPSQEDIFAI